MPVRSTDFPKMKVLFATLAVSITNSLREIGVATADLWRVNEALDKQRAVLDTGYGATSKPVLIYDYYRWAILWITCFGYAK